MFWLIPATVSFYYMMKHLSLMIDKARDKGLHLIITIVEMLICAFSVGCFMFEVISK